MEFSKDLLVSLSETSYICLRKKESKMEGYGIDVNQKKWVGEPSPDPPTAQDGKHLLNIIYDTKNIRSLFYHIIGTDYLNHSRNSFFKPLSNTYQFYIWKSKK